MPILNIESSGFKKNIELNLQDFKTEMFGALEYPVIFKGLGNMFDSLKPSFQAFALNLKQEQAKANFPGRVVDDVPASDAEQMKNLLTHSLVSKLATPVQQRAVFGPCMPEYASTSPTICSSGKSVMFGNNGQFEATAVDRCYFGTLRYSFSGERTIAAAPLGVVLTSYKAATGKSDLAAQLQPCKMSDVKSWFRNLTEDPSPVNV